MIVVTVTSVPFVFVQHKDIRIPHVLWNCNLPPNKHRAFHVAHLWCSLCYTWASLQGCHFPRFFARSKRVQSFSSGWLSRYINKGRLTIPFSASSATRFSVGHDLEWCQSPGWPWLQWFTEKRFSSVLGPDAVIHQHNVALSASCCIWEQSWSQ